MLAVRRKELLAVERQRAADDLLASAQQALAALRELFGSGSVFGVMILQPVNQGGWYVPNGLMVLAPAAFFLIGGFIWIVRVYRPEQVEEDFSVGALFESGHEVHLR